MNHLWYLAVVERDSSLGFMQQWATKVMTTQQFYQIVVVVFLSKLCNFSYLIFSTDLYSCRLNQSSSIFPTICYELSFGCKAACHIGNMELVHAKANKHEFRHTKETHSLIFCSNKPSTISKLFSVFAVIPSGPSVPPSPTCLGLGPCTPLHASTFTQSY